MAEYEKLIATILLIISLYFVMAAVYSMKQKKKRYDKRNSGNNNRKKQFPDGSSAYFDKETGKAVKLPREQGKIYHKLPKEIWRHITPQQKGTTSWKEVLRIKD